MICALVTGVQKCALPILPTVNDDTFNQSAENADVVGDVKLDNGNGADVEGADGTASYAYNNDHDGVGTLDFDSDGTFIYTPADGEEGTVTFTYTLTDADRSEEHTSELQSLMHISYAVFSLK